MTVSNEPPKQAAILPIGETASEVFRVFGNNLGHLTSLGLWPVALSAGATAIVFAAGDSGLINLFSVLLDLAIYTLFAVAWHRLVLLSATDESSAPWAWQPRHNNFFAYALVVNVIVYAVIFVPLLVAGVSLGEFFGELEIASGSSVGTLDESADTLAAALAVTFFMMLAVWYLFMRLSFVFPARAVDEKYGLADSWRHTRGNGLVLMAISFLTVAPAYLLFAVAIGMVAAVFSLTGGADAALIAGIALSVVMTIVVLALTVTLTSVAFRRATGWVPGPAATPPLQG